MRLTIRWRLTLWNLLALAVVLLAFAILVYAIVARSLSRGLDSRLASAFEQLRHDHRLVRDTDTRLADWVAEFKEHMGFFCVVYGSDRRVRLRTEELTDDSIPEHPDRISFEPSFRDVNLPILSRQCAFLCRLQLADETLDVLLLAPLADVDRDLGQLRTALATAIPFILFFSGVVGYCLARKALNPVARLQALADEISAERLDRRLPVDNPHDELGRLTQTINAMIARLERSFLEIRRFTADASHELRTPLTAIRAEAEVALDKPLSLLEHQQLLGSILEECERLTRLTDQLLALAREDAGIGRRECQYFDLANLLSDVAETMQPLAEARGQRFEVNLVGPMSLSGDESRLRQVFYNLIGNACKYTPEGGTITVCLKPVHTVAVVTISDTGIGIAPEHLPHVFERFYRVDRARSRAEGGTGLGLNIAQGIIAAQGGTIELTSSPGQGTTCTVTLPRGENEGTI